MNLKRLVEISPAIASFLVFISFLKLYLFYGHWGINISPYLDFSEITLSFLSDLSIMIFFFVLLVVQLVIATSLLYAVEKRNITAANTIPLKENGATTALAVENKSRSFIEEADELFENHPTKMLFVILGITIVFAGLFLWFKELVFLYFAFTAFAQLLFYFLAVFLKIEKNKPVLQITFSVTMFLFSVCLAIYDIKQTENNPKIVEIESDGGSFSTNSNLIFLGKTNNFYFLFDRIKNKSIVISSATVKKITASK